MCQYRRIAFAFEVFITFFFLCVMNYVILLRFNILNPFFCIVCLLSWLEKPVTPYSSLEYLTKRILEINFIWNTCSTSYKIEFFFQIMTLFRTSTRFLKNSQNFIILCKIWSTRCTARCTVHQLAVRNFSNHFWEFQSLTNKIWKFSYLFCSQLIRNCFLKFRNKFPNNRKILLTSI